MVLLLGIILLLQEETDMNSCITIKSFSNGLKLIIDSNADLKDILNDIQVKFGESKRFFKGTKTALTFEGRKLDFDEERKIISEIEKAAEMSILYIICEDKLSMEHYVQLVNKPLLNDEDVTGINKIYAGTLKRGAKLESESGIVILGDVEPGAKIQAGGSIVILGGLYGSAIIDVPMNEDKYFISSNDFSPEQAKIGKYTYVSREKSKWVVKPKFQPKLARVFDSNVVLYSISKETLQELCNNISK